MLLPRRSSERGHGSPDTTAPDEQQARLPRTRQRPQYNEDEQVTGLFTMIEDNLTLPFATTVLGVPVSIVGVDLRDSGQVVAVCSRDGLRQAIPILDLPMPTPPPAGAEWIEAYRRWAA